MRWLPLLIAAFSGLADPSLLSPPGFCQAQTTPAPSIAEMTTDELRRAASSGDTEAAFALAQAYAFGRGIPKSMDSAKVWFDAAARRGHVGAMINLGAIHYNGIGGSAELSLAYAWFELAAAFGSAIALYNLVEVEGRIESADRRRGRDLSATILPQILAAMSDEEIERARNAARKTLADPTARRLIALLNTVRHRENRIESERQARGPLPSLTPVRPED